MQPDTLYHAKRTAARMVSALARKIELPFEVASYKEGVDLSAWQGKVDFAKLKTKVSFAYLRAGYGNKYVDPRVDEYRKGCHANKIPFGLYWFVVPGKDFTAHAKLFHAVWSVDPGTLPPCFDLETTGGLKKTPLESWWKKMYDVFCDKSQLELQAIMTYTSPGFLNKAIGLTNWLKYTQLWVAHWTTAPQPQLPVEWGDIANPKTWQNWQYSATGKGSDYGVSSRYVDLDRGKFDIAPPPPGDEEMKMRVTADVLNVRSGPGTNFADVGDLHAGDVVDMLNVGGTSAWVQIKGGAYDGKWICVQLNAARFCEPVE